MKKIFFSLLCLSLLSLSCNDDDSEINNLTSEQSKIIGSWQIDRGYGSIDGTEKITFTNDMKYSVVLTRTESYDGPCEYDPYCENDYSGEFWFQDSKLYYNSSELGWTDYFDNWSVEGDLLVLDGDTYIKL